MNQGINTKMIKLGYKHSGCGCKNNQDYHDNYKKPDQHFKLFWLSNTYTLRYEIKAQNWHTISGPLSELSELLKNIEKLPKLN